MEPSQERREKIKELVSKIRHEEKNERTEGSTFQKKAKADCSDKSCKGKQSTKVGNVNMLSSLNNSLLVFNNLY